MADSGAQCATIFVTVLGNAPRACQSSGSACKSSHSACQSSDSAYQSSDSACQSPAGANLLGATNISS